MNAYSADAPKNEMLIFWATRSQNIKRIREQRGMSQGDISRALGMDRGYISRIENGLKNPTIANIEKIAKALEVSDDELLK